MCSKSGDEELITSLHIWQMLHYCYCQHSQNIILGFWDVSEFCKKLRMSVRRVTLLLLLMLSCLRLALNLHNLSICQKLPDPDLPKMANGDGKWQMWQCLITQQDEVF